MKRDRSAFTLIEITVGLSIAVLVLAMVWTFYTGAATSSGKTAEHAEAMRSALLAAETIRRDVVRATLADPRHDLGIPDSGTALDLHRLAAVASDLSGWTSEKISFALKALPAVRGVYRLERAAESGAAAISSCLIAGLQCRLLAAGTLAPGQAYLQVTLVGAGAYTPKAAFTSSTLVPLTPWYRPARYRLDLATGRRVP